MYGKEYIIELNQIDLAIMFQFVFVLDKGNEVEGHSEDGITKETNDTGNDKVDRQSSNTNVTI